MKIFLSRVVTSISVYPRDGGHYQIYQKIIAPMINDSLLPQPMKDKYLQKVIEEGGWKLYRHDL